MATARPISLTLSEASYVVGRSSVVINKAVDRGMIRAAKLRQGKGTLRTLGPAELRFLKLTGNLDKDLTPTGRRKLYEGPERLSWWIGAAPRGGGASLRLGDGRF